MNVTGVLTAVAGVLLCASVLSTVLRTHRPELAMGLSLLAGVLVLGVVLSRLTPFFSSLKQMLVVGGLSDNASGVVLKGVGVCLLTQLTADVCRDAGQTALAGKAELTGRVLLLLISVPLYEQILTLIVGLVNGQAVGG